jgi:hypothetical protein
MIGILIKTESLDTETYIDDVNASVISNLHAKKERSGTDPSLSPQKGPILLNH